MHLYLALGSMLISTCVYASGLWLFKAWYEKNTEDSRAPSSTNSYTSHEAHVHRTTNITKHSNADTHGHHIRDEHDYHIESVHHYRRAGMSRETLCIW